MSYDTEKNLTNHPPTSDAIITRMEAVRHHAKTLATMIDELCPNSREKALSFTKLEETVMWAMAALARNQDELT